MTSGCPWPKPPVWNPGPKIEIPHPENHILKVFRFGNRECENPGPKVEIPSPEIHILKFPRPQSWDPKSWKPCPENHISSMNSLSCQCRRQTERGDKHKGRNPHVLFTAAYIFLFAESSPSYGHRPVLGPSLFSMSSGRRKLASRIPSILSAH
jgi:hypothetical protein